MPVETVVTINGVPTNITGLPQTTEIASVVSGAVLPQGTAYRVLVQVTPPGGPAVSSEDWCAAGELAAAAQLVGAQAAAAMPVAPPPVP